MVIFLPVSDFTLQVRTTSTKLLAMTYEDSRLHRPSQIDPLIHDTHTFIPVHNLCYTLLP